MEKIILISIIFSTFAYQIQASNKQTQALSLLYKAKWSGNSAIDTSHFEPPQHMNKASLVLPQEGLKKKDKIDRLPGQPYVKFDQYGGYVTVPQLERFPEYKGREFYISGESYAGHYVPQLAHTILHYNKMANKTLINLKGILIGNAVINDYTDSIGMYDYLGSHAIVSDETIDLIRKHCDFSANATTQSDECNKANNVANRDLEHIDVYNIYSPSCLNENLTSKPKRMLQSTIDPCSEYYTYAYMNSEDVQEALHANVTKLDHDWEPCSDIISNWGDSPVTIIPLLMEFMQNNLRVWIFSGDTDARVPVTSTKYSISSMKLPIKTPWHQWLHQGEVAGFTQVYEGDLTFSTILGAGHQVPSYKPKTAFALITHFLTGKPLNDSRH